MSQSAAIEFAAPQSPEPRDLLARLYREIGLSAVAAALEVIAKPSAPADAETIEPKIPAFLRDEDIAA